MKYLLEKVSLHQKKFLIFKRSYMNKLIGISEMSKILNLVDPITKRPLNHILRYWEKNLKK